MKSSRLAYGFIVTLGVIICTMVVIFVIKMKVENNKNLFLAAPKLVSIARKVEGPENGLFVPSLVDMSDWGRYFSNLNCAGEPNTKIAFRCAVQIAKSDSTVETFNYYGNGWWNIHGKWFYNGEYSDVSRELDR